MSVWYYAYGSNLWADQLLRRTAEHWPADQPPRRARLSAHRLIFNAHLDGEVFANIEPADESHSVLGVCYFSSEAGLAKLDAFESGYARRSVCVQLEEGELLDALAYVVLPEFTGPAARPSEAYLGRITRGAREHAFPEDYVQMIERLARGE